MDPAERILRRPGWVCAVAFMILIVVPGYDGWEARIAEPPTAGASWCGNSPQRDRDESDRVISAFPLIAFPFVLAGCLVRHPVAKSALYSLPTALLAAMWLYVDMERKNNFWGIGWAGESVILGDLDRHMFDAGVVFCAIGALGLLRGDSQRRWRVLIRLGVLMPFFGIVASFSTGGPGSSAGQVIGLGLVMMALAAAMIDSLDQWIPASSRKLDLWLIVGTLVLSKSVWRVLDGVSIEQETRALATALLAGLALAWFLLWSWEREEPPLTPA